MDNKINAWLEDIERSINEIFEFLPVKRFSGVSKRFKNQKSGRAQY